LRNFDKNHEFFKSGSFDLVFPVVLGAEEQTVRGRRSRWKWQKKVQSKNWSKGEKQRNKEMDLKANEAQGKIGKLSRNDGRSSQRRPEAISYSRSLEGEIKNTLRISFLCLTLTNSE
jgi:hypothetical protein